MRKFYANIEFTMIRQIEFEADETLSEGEIEDLALKQAAKEYGEWENSEILELDYTI